MTHAPPRVLAATARTISQGALRSPVRHGSILRYCVHLCSRIGIRWRVESSAPRRSIAAGTSDGGVARARHHGGSEFATKASGRQRAKSAALPLMIESPNERLI